MSHARTPVKTELGILRGRDCVYLDSHVANSELKTLTLQGEINCDLCDPPVWGLFLPYTLRFLGVTSFDVVDLDSSRWDWDSSFEEVQAQRPDGLTTYTVQTYDYVFTVACRSFDLVVEHVADLTRHSSRRLRRGLT